MIKKTALLLSVILVFAFAGFAKKTATKKSAVPLLTQAEQDSFYYHFYEGIRIKNADSLDKAIVHFERCLQIDSLDAGALAEAGMLYATFRQNAKAIKYLEKATTLSNNNWWYSMRLISLYADNKRYEKAVAFAEKLQKQYPQKEDIYQVLISLYKDTKQYKKAIAAYDKLESIYGIDESFSFDKFRLYLELNQLNKGVAEIDKLIRKFPAESRYRVLRGDIYMQQQLPVKALEVYNSVLADDPSNPHIYVSLSEYYNAVNEPDKAVSSIINALKNDQLGVDEKIDILNQYIQKLLSDTTRLNETESLFKLLTERYPFEARVHEYYAQFLNYRNRPMEAVQELETITGIDPKNDGAWLQILQLQLRLNKYEDLLLTADKAIGVLPENALWLFYKGIAQFQQEKYEASLQSYIQSSAVVKPAQTVLKSDIYTQIADVHFKLGRKNEAFAAYDTALVANPKNIGALNNYAYYLSVEKTDLNKAEKMSAQTIEKEPNNSTYLDTYAWIFYQKENYTLAKFYIERAVNNLKAGQDPGVLLEHYGDILLKTGNNTKALEMWKKSWESGNKSDELKLKIELLSNPNKQFQKL